MAQVLINEDTMVSIAETIRSKTGKEEKILPADMPSEIGSISSGVAEPYVLEKYDGSCRLTDAVMVGQQTVRNGAFYMASSLKTIVMPDTATVIDEQAFDSCDSLEEIVIPENVTNIRSYAFAFCSSLKTVTFKGEPSKIDPEAFNSCGAITFNVPWSEGSIADTFIPWGADASSTINYNYTEE